jgi:simple sugar transport system permease protein
VGVLPAVNILLAFLVSAILFYYLDINPVDAAEIMWYGAFGTGEGVGFTSTTRPASSLPVCRWRWPSTPVCSTSVAKGRPISAAWASVWSVCCWVIPCRSPCCCRCHHRRRPVRRGLGLHPGLAASQARQPHRHHHHHVQLHRRLLMAYLLVEVFKPAGSMATESKVFAEASWLPKMSELAGAFGMEMSNSPLNISFFWALPVRPWCGSSSGIPAGATRSARSAPARVRPPAGISYPKVVILAMVISGMLSGFFALNVLQGELHQLSSTSWKASASPALPWR